MTRTPINSLTRYASKNQPEFRITRHPDALKLINKYKSNYDLIFMDIEMPHMSGMEAAKAIRRIGHGVTLVFVSNMAQYAVAGYGVRALDFVVKPMTYETFAYKFRRAVETASKRAKDTIVVSSHGGKRRLFVSDIDYVEVVNHKLIYHLGAERVEVWSSMKSAREQLEKYGFAPCSASFLVNMRKVRSFAGGDVVVGDGVIKISRKKKEEFLKLLAQYMC